MLGFRNHVNRLILFDIDLHNLLSRDRRDSVSSGRGEHLYSQISLLIEKDPGVTGRVVVFLRKNGIAYAKHTISNASEPDVLKLDILVKSKTNIRDVCQKLSTIKGVRTIQNCGVTDSSAFTVDDGQEDGIIDSIHLSSGEIKNRCKELMVHFFGPDIAGIVDEMDEEECVRKCRAKVAGLIGEDQARIFDKI